MAGGGFRECAAGEYRWIYTGCASLLRDVQQWAFNYPRFACVSISMQIKEVGWHRLRRNARASDEERGGGEEEEVEWINEEDHEAWGVKVRKRESRWEGRQWKWRRKRMEVKFPRFEGNLVPRPQRLMMAIV